MSTKSPSRARVTPRAPKKPHVIDPVFADALTALVAAGAKRALAEYQPAPMSNAIAGTLGVGVTNVRTNEIYDAPLGLGDLLGRLEGVRERLCSVSGQLSVSVERMTGRTITPRLLGQDIAPKESGQLGRAHALVSECFAVLDMLDELAASTAALL
jgi:hypothetical protein